MEVHIKRSKCDQFAEGIKLVIGATGSDPCPVAAMLGFLVQRANTPGALFLFKDGRLLTHVHFVSALRSALVESGIDPSLYAGHSFRVGAATTAALRGLQDSLTKILGRWNSEAQPTWSTSRLHGRP